MPKQFVTISNQQIPWSFVQTVRLSGFGGDWDSTIDCFWKSRNAKGEKGIIKYIKAGFKPNKLGVRYSMVPSKEREEGKMESVRQWWNKEVYEPKNKPQSLAEIFAGIGAKRA